jgi:HAD superfamily hydrolase (TIGR01509 family)
VIEPANAVFFDVAGTLFSDRDLRDFHLEQLRFVADAIGAQASDKGLRAAYRQGLGAAYQSLAVRPGYLHRELFGSAFAAMAGALGGRLDEAQTSAAVDRQYRATLEHARLRPGGRDTLAALRSAGVHVQLVSNIDDEQLDGLIERLNLRPLIDARTSSEEARSCKPDPGIYRLALAKAGCRPESVLFVGDSLSHDVEGPAASGMRTAWLVPERQGDASDATADFVIERLDQVPALVRLEPIR